MSPRAWRRAAELVLLVVIVGHALLCPFTKVEESFNMQAIHDVLVHGRDLASYDHHEFPGVVPRTFLGALVVSTLSTPVHTILEAFAELPNRHASQVAARLVLGFLCWMAFRRFNASAASRFGDAAAGWNAVVWALQFHLPFYLSRTLPNVFALCVVLLALEAWLLDKVPRALGLLTLAACVFRCDVVVLLAPLTLQLLLTRRIGPLGVVWTGLKCAIPSVLASVVVDSALWGRWLWPEGEVLFFNTVDNRSSEWGEMPLLWYFTSALPRALSGTALLLPLGLVRHPTRPLDLFRSPLAAVDGSVVYYVLPGVVMVCLYSLLPHKELRFIFPALPLFNLAAGIGMSRAVGGACGGGDGGKVDDGDGERRKRRVLVRVGLAGLAALAVVATAGSTVLAVAASRVNYPGAVALEALHRAIDEDKRVSHAPVKVHIDAQAAMSGVSRFGERKKGVFYSKQEKGVDLSKFDFVLTDDPWKGRLMDMFEVRETIEGFDGILFRRFWSGDEAADGGGSGGIVTVSTSNKMYVMARWFPPPPREDLV